MDCKMPIAREDENPVASQGGAKAKKKGLAIDGDEYSIGTELSEYQQNLGFEEQNHEGEIAPVTGKKKGKKGSSKAARPRDEDREKTLEEEEDDVPAMVFAGKKNPKSKKSGNSLFSCSGFGALEEDDKKEIYPRVGKEADKYKENNDGEGEDDPVVMFSGKSSKSSKKSNGLFAAAAFDAILDEGDEIDAAVSEQQPIDEYKTENDYAPVIAFSRKKSSKSSKKSSTLFTASTFNGLDEGGDTDDKNKEEDEEPPVITFSGKSKSSKKSNTLFNNALLDEENSGDASVSEQKSITRSDDNTDDGSVLQNEDAPTVSFSGKKKSSKSKKNNGIFPTSSFDIGLGDEVTEHEQPSLKSSSIEADGNNASDIKIKKQVSEDLVETSKNKKKKSGRTAQEEDDLDKILAELGEGVPLLKPTAPLPQEEKVQIQPVSVGPVDATGEKEAEVEGGESAAAKKKKKKKEKEKEKKAAAAVAAAVEVKEEKQDETKNKFSDKKLPKHVREMQEALARCKEAEERKKREEEERLRKEEEESRRLEEIERQAKEARHRKKEREKEKLLKKKQEGKLLTGKQKEEARRLEAMRNQILANAGGLLPPTVDTGGVIAKRLMYQTKMTKLPPSQANGGLPQVVENIEAKQSQQETIVEVDSLEVENVEDVEAMNAEETLEADHGIEENRIEEDDDEDEWDAKSWDDGVVTLPVKSAFSEEEDDSELEPVVKKETKRATPPVSRDAGAPPAAAMSAVADKKLVTSPSMNNQDIESKEDQHEFEVRDKNRRKEAELKREARMAGALLQRNADNLRSPICCIMGHVDTGKTKLLDCIRGTKVQEGEAGGITQQIGATYFPAENIRERTSELKADAKLKVPGLLVIDTPGHESFMNLRSRGSDLCDIAILVVDIMHGLEPQTIESLNLLKMRNTEFIVALNKVDRLYGWKTCSNAPIVKAMKQQSKDVQNEFNMRLTQIITQFMEQGLNTELYYKNKELGDTFNIVPTSAISGEGIPDLLLLLVQWTQKTMVEKLMFSNEVQCTVLEVKVIEGHGTTIDVVLVNGVLHEGDQIVICGMQGPIVATIRALLTPHPMKELRVKVRFL
ncbi:hypothetical protein HHK36_030953 [Tetracentron sinense]|uniref:Tr-type G domain-containing protein n=1 Tax=Tetracentron sinense TaxID=13715 RepID=A0A834Y8Q8_TETSI|nr:hypothetical protein HHK36_030953 [Tetracentron sinense]